MNTKFKNTWDDVSEADGSHGDETKVKCIKKRPILKYRSAFKVTQNPFTHTN